MSETFLTSDLHFDHANIIKFCNRGFKDVDQMTESFIRNWNSVVKSQDSVYVLGDFCFSDRSEIYFNSLNGCKYLIKGNHDRDKTLKLRWGWVKDTYMLKHDADLIWLSHYPHRSWPNSYHGSYHAFGHIHSKDGNKYFRSHDVGVDCWGFTPVNVKTFIDKLKIEDITDHHGRT